MDTVALEHHLTSPQGQDRTPQNAFTVTAGGGACCDEITFSLSLSPAGDAVADAGFSATGCGTATAAASAAVTLARGGDLLNAARIGPAEIAAELGGLSPGKLHAAELAADALARALGKALRSAGRIGATAHARTLVAMSGGVDSSVAALLTTRAAETVAVTLELFSDHENDAERSCCSASAVSQARALAHQMNIPHITIDLREEFRRGVVEPFIASHARGETPNPCVGCNGHVRIDAMIELADRLGAGQLATGHYARLADLDDPDGPLLRTARDPAKDQSYMLAALAPGSLRRLRFPLGDLSKPEVREIAAQAELPVASKVDSQDLCFLAGTSRARFLARHGKLTDRPGPIVDLNSNTIGRHRGQHHFTVGQRRGLPLATGTPLYVLEKTGNRITVGPRDALGTACVALRGVTLHRDAARVDRVKLRYRQRPLAARLRVEQGAGRRERILVDLETPADAAAPGQIACLMDGDLIIGWGTICRGE